MLQKFSLTQICPWNLEFSFTYMFFLPSTQVQLMLLGFSIGSFSAGWGCLFMYIFLLDF